jgi:hypothetical protein
MILLVIVAGLCVAVLMLAFVIHGTPFGRVRTVEELASEMRPTDLAAFLNVVDKEEEAYLRSMLNPSDFLLVHRCRIAATTVYLFNVIHNSGIMVAVGEAAQRNQDAEVAELGKTIANNAVRLRVFSAAALCRLMVSYVFPSTLPVVTNVISRYRSIGRSVRALCEIQAPSEVNRILAAL